MPSDAFGLFMPISLGKQRGGYGRFSSPRATYVQTPEGGSRLPPDLRRQVDGGAFSVSGLSETPTSSSRCGGDVSVRSVGVEHLRRRGLRFEVN